MRYSVFLIILILLGCDARRADPVRISQPEDESLSCQALRTQFEANHRRIHQLSGADADTENVNAALIAGGLVFSPSFLAVDLSQKESIELNAFYDRNRRLAYLYEKKSCSEVLK